MYKTAFSIFFFVIFIYCSDIYSQESLNWKVSNEWNNYDKSLTFNKNKNQDTTINSDEDSDIYLSPEEFVYAGKRRYTFNGELPLKESSIRPLNFGIVAGAATSFMVAQHLYQLSNIWKDKTEFRIIEDGPYGLYADKVGHCYGAYLNSYIYSELLMWSGLSWDMSVLTGTLIGLSYQTYVEIMDGYGKNWGFSPSDMYSDIGGALLSLGQHYIPFMQNFQMKFMYFPADWHSELKRKPSEMFIDDYSSQTFFVSIDIYNILPENLKKYWIPWLQLSIGYAARNLCSPGYDCDLSKSKPYYDNYVYGSPRYIIALDYDLVRLLPEGAGFWNWLRQSLNYIKLPSPAIEFGETTRVFLLYPFHF